MAKKTVRKKKISKKIAKKQEKVLEMIPAIKQNKGGGRPKYEYRIIYQEWVYSLKATVTLRSLADKYNIPLKILYNYAEKHHWGDDRTAFHQDVDKQVQAQALHDAAMVKLLNIENGAKMANIILADLDEAEKVGTMSRSGLKDVAISWRAIIQGMALLSGDPTEIRKDLNPFGKMNEKEGKAIGDDFRDAGKPLKIKMLSDLKKLKRKRVKK